MDVVPSRAPLSAEDSDSEAVNMPGSIVISGVACGEVNKVERSTTVLVADTGLGDSLEEVAIVLIAEKGNKPLI